ncbi:MAG: hypothetical protein ACRD26_22690 [Vicinamibacterales bacterium]
MKHVLEAAVNLARRQQRRMAGRARWAAKVGEEGVRDAVHGTRKAGRGVRDAAVNAAKDVFRRLRRPIRTATRRRHQLEEQRALYRTEWQVERELETIVGRGRLLVAGPWLSEVGYETLYWLPFLHWVKAAFRLEPDRLVAVSRGGVASWYEDVAARYVEIWDDLDPAEFARRNAERGVTKQYEPSALDRDVLEHVARRIGTRDFEVIHPGLMYRLFALYWSGQRAMGFLDAHTRFTRHAAAPLIDPALLPREYVAVKFYAARSLPDTPEIRSWLRAMVAGLAERMPVVLLDTGLVLEDDHADYALAPGDGVGRVISARGWMTPQTNLGVQTQIVAGAKAFVGTCGSLAWLAPRLGVDTSAVFVDPKWLHAHLAVAMRAYHKLDAGRFAVADLRAVDVLAHALSIK